MLQVIQGKPGTGKSYHVCKMVVRDLREWCKYEKKTGEMFPRRIYTNLPFYPDKISARIEQWDKTGIDAAKYFHFLDMKDDWWEAIPDDALIVVDEVHEHLGSENDRSYKELLKEFRNYIATHRHHGHDVIMITQHIDNVSMDILRIAERIVELQNFKAGRVPFFNIELADIDVVRKAFGSETQFYIANFGRVVGRSIKYESNATHAITPDYFGLYDSHNKSDGSESGSGDRPSVVLSKLDAVRWFASKYWKSVSLKILISIGAIFLFVYAVQAAPGFLSNLTASSMRVNGGTLDEPKKKPPEKPKAKPAVLYVNDSGKVLPKNSKQNAKSLPVTPAKIIELQSEIKTLKEKNSDLEAKIQKLKAGKKIVAVLPDSILLADGSRVDVGGECSFDGESVEVLKSVNVKLGKVEFDSGRIVWLR